MEGWGKGFETFWRRTLREIKLSPLPHPTGRGREENLLLFLRVGRTSEGKGGELNLQPGKREEKGNSTTLFSLEEKK